MPVNRMNLFVWLGLLVFALAFFPAAAWLTAGRLRHFNASARAETTTAR